MRKRTNTTRKPSRRLQHLSVSTILVAILILAIGAITVLSRQRAEAESKAQMTEKTNLRNSKLAAQDVPASGDAQDQQLTRDEAQKLGAGLNELVNQSTDGLVEVQHADGSVSVDLEGRFQNVTVAKVNKDGSVSQSCVDNPKAAGAFFGIDPKLIDPSVDSRGPKPTRVSPARNKTE
ncbi:MAG: hypothetical protein AABN95_26630 [Acidobacteriota bacterium]